MPSEEEFVATLDSARTGKPAPSKRRMTNSRSSSPRRNSPEQAAAAAVAGSYPPLETTRERAPAASAGHAF